MTLPFDAMPVLGSSVESASLKTAATSGKTCSYSIPCFGHTEYCSRTDSKLGWLETAAAVISVLLMVAFEWIKRCTISFEQPNVIARRRRDMPCSSCALVILESKDSDPASAFDRSLGSCKMLPAMEGCF